MVSAIILAAGESKRMGITKAILPYRGKTFVQCVIDLYAGMAVRPLIVVVGADAIRVIEYIDEENVTVVMNEQYRRGQLSSVIAGLEAAEKSSPDAVIIHPVDHPAVERDTVARILQAFEETKKSIIIPLFDGRRGHPTLFAASMFDELKSAPPNEGARAVARAHPGNILELPVDDEGILRNIDTLESYENLD